MTVSSRFFHNPNVRKYEYSLQKPKKIAEAGSTYKRRRALHDKDGNPVEFTFLTNAENTVRVNIGNIIKSICRSLA